MVVAMSSTVGASVDINTGRKLRLSLGSCLRSAVRTDPCTVGRGKVGSMSSEASMANSLSVGQ